VGEVVRPGDGYGRPHAREFDSPRGHSGGERVEDTTLGIMATMGCFGVLIGIIVTAVIAALWED